MTRSLGHGPGAPCVGRFGRLAATPRRLGYDGPARHRRQQNGQPKGAGSRSPDRVGRASRPESRRTSQVWRSLARRRCSVHCHGQRGWKARVVGFPTRYRLAMYSAATRSYPGLKSRLWRFQLIDQSLVHISVTPSSRIASLRVLAPLGYRLAQKAQTKSLMSTQKVSGTSTCPC